MPNELEQFIESVIATLNRSAAVAVERGVERQSRGDVSGLVFAEGVAAGLKIAQTVVLAHEWSRSNQ